MFRPHFHLGRCVICSVQIQNTYSTLRCFLEIFLAVITSATEVGNTRPSASRPEAVAKIHEVGFYSLSSSNWDSLSTYDGAPSPTFAEHADALLRDSYSGQSTPNSATLEHPCMPLTKIISAGTFYYALTPYWDLSSRLSQRVQRDEKSAQDTGHFDDRFIWNEYIVRSLLDFRDRLEPQERDDLDRCQFIVSPSTTGSRCTHNDHRCLRYKVMWEYTHYHYLPHLPMDRL